MLGIYEENGKLIYKRGWERIPENWYRTPIDYSVMAMNMDIVTMLVQRPVLASIGGNMGEVNSFTGVDLADLTGGLLNIPMLLEDNNLMCFVFQLLKTLAPNSLSSIFTIIDVPLQILTETLDLRLLDLACPAFDDIKQGGTDLGTVLDDLVELLDGFGGSGEQ